MIVELIRYRVAEADVDAALEARRALSAVRERLGLPPGYILLADPPADEGPAMVWQCGYQSETQLAVAEAAIAGSTEYSEVRDRLAPIVEAIEIEMYVSDADENPGVTID
ncbi:MAG TPA: hypothetical protein VFB34_07960 [Chloroflexota bacterium]|nr:hypothetical protein [Chloroflexota bacterium]